MGRPTGEQMRQPFHLADPMNPFHIGLVAALCCAWLPGGLIHRGQQAQTPTAPPALQIEACELAGSRDCRQTANAQR